MPTATDLVTDLPADFEVFGQAVATSMADLLGGTTGQILSKTSATDMDFTWIANDQGDITGVTAGNGISVTDPTGPVPTVAINTAVTADLTTAQTLTNKTLTSPVLTTPSISNINAKADILVGTADNTLGILSVGTNGQVLTADSTVSPSGLKWATPASGSTFVGASAWMNSTVAISNATFTAVALADESFDTNSIHNNVTNNSRMTIPAGYAGKWLINGQIMWAGGTGLRSIALYKNGSYYGVWDNTPPTSGSQYQTMSVVLSLAFSDYIEMFVYQTSGGNLNLYGNSAGNGTITALSVSYLGA
jgi:hypothetical protein